MGQLDSLRELSFKKIKKKKKKKEKKKEINIGYCVRWVVQ
jgi:thiamine pyrophosphokinase